MSLAIVLVGLQERKWHNLKVAQIALKWSMQEDERRKNYDHADVKKLD